MEEHIINTFFLLLNSNNQYKLNIHLLNMICIRDHILDIDI